MHDPCHLRVLLQKQLAVEVEKLPQALSNEPGKWRRQFDFVKNFADTVPEILSPVLVMAIAAIKCGTVTSGETDPKVYQDLLNQFAADIAFDDIGKNYTATWEGKTLSGSKHSLFACAAFCVIGGLFHQRILPRCLPELKWGGKSFDKRVLEGMTLMHGIANSSTVIGGCVKYLEKRERGDEFTDPYQVEPSYIVSRLRLQELDPGAIEAVAVVLGGKGSDGIINSLSTSTFVGLIRGLVSTQVSSHEQRPEITDKSSKHIMLVCMILNRDWSQQVFS
jgi:hypothetical protein